MIDASRSQHFTALRIRYSDVKVSSFQADSLSDLLRQRELIFCPWSELGSHRETNHGDRSKETAQGLQGVKPLP